MVVEAPDGEEIVRAGGVWDGRLSAYVSKPEGFKHQVQRVTLQESQVPIMRGLARWIGKVLRGEKDRPVVLVSGGKPGSGKTFALAGMFTHLVALTWPGDEQFITVLNIDNRRECIFAMETFGLPEWIATQKDDPRGGYIEWVTGARLTWISSRNPKKLRQRGLPIRHVLINEAQLQSEDLYAIAQLAGRSLGGLCSLAMNPPTTDAGNWSTKLWHGIKDGKVQGEIYEMDSALNAAVDHSYIDAAGQAVRVAAPRLAAAEVDGIMQSAGEAAFPTFSGEPYNYADPMAGGCVGTPPEVGWEDITRERTILDFDPDGNDVGADRVVGVDFQKTPGVAGDVARLFRTPPPPAPCPICGPDGCTILYIERQVVVAGVELAFSQSLFDDGYTGNGFRPDGKHGPKVLLIGDGTGDRQNSEHNKKKGPPSFHAMKSFGWRIVPPMYHHKNHVAWNPDVRQSLKQMYNVLQYRHVLFGPECRNASNGFPSLVDSMRNARRNEDNGKLLDEGNNQHGPDGVRYLACKYLPRPQPAADAPADASVMDAFRGIRLTES